MAHTAATAAAAAAEKAAATGARKGMAPDEVEAAIRTAEAAARGGVSAFVDAFGARGAAAKDGGGESFLRVHRITVPEALRARRVNRRRRRRRGGAPRGHQNWQEAALCRDLPGRRRGGDILMIL
eukprot:COSAG01_NODE_230_length_21075_cov_13.811603_4_plen_125_part_00